MSLPQAGDAGGDLLQRRRDVGSGVAIGHREDVDLVQMLRALADEMGPAMTARESLRPSRYPIAITTSGRPARSPPSGPLTGRLVLLGHNRKPVEVKEDDAAAHAGPGIDLLDPPIQKTALHGFFQK